MNQARSFYSYRGEQAEQLASHARPHDMRILAVSSLATLEYDLAGLSTSTTAMCPANQGQAHQHQDDHPHHVGKGTNLSPSNEGQHTSEDDFYTEFTDKTEYPFDGYDMGAGLDEDLMAHDEDLSPPTLVDEQEISPTFFR